MNFTCANCGKKFKPIKCNKRFCSVKCSRSVNNKKYYDKHLRVKRDYPLYPIN